MNDFNPAQMVELLVAAIRGSGEHFNLITRDSKTGFQLACPPQPELVRLMAANETRFRKILRKAMLAAEWNGGDTEAALSIIPMKGKPDTPFERFTLPFPTGPRAVA